MPQPAPRYVDDSILTSILHPSDRCPPQLAWPLTSLQGAVSAKELENSQLKRELKLTKNALAEAQLAAKNKEESTKELYVLKGSTGVSFLNL